MHLVSNLKSDLNYLFPFASFNPLRKVNIRRRGLDYALAKARSRVALVRQTLRAAEDIDSDVNFTQVSK